MGHATKRVESRIAVQRQDRPGYVCQFEARQLAGLVKRGHR